MKTSQPLRRLWSDSTGAMLVAVGAESLIPRRRAFRDHKARKGKAPTNWKTEFALVAPAGNLSGTYQLSKRICDLVGGLALLAIFGPLMLVVYLVLTVTTRGKAIFVQERVGHCGRLFRMYKFRTMRSDAEQLKHLVQNEQSGPVFKNRRDPRITRIGRFLRMTSIDELPQIFNVIRGDMALVGPRPPVPREVEQYEPWQRRRLAIKPGLTCLWQVSGRCEVGFEDWVRMDIRYAQRQSLRTDLELLARTPWSVLSGRGAY